MKVYFIRSLITGLIILAALFTNTVLAQTNCPSGIVIHVNSGTDFIYVWSPLSAGDYNLTRAWDAVTHTGNDRYSMDLSMPGDSDLGKAVYMPFTSRVWSSTNGSYGKTMMMWDPGSGIVIRFAHLNQFSSILLNPNGGWYGAGTKAGYIGGTGNWPVHLHVSAYRNVKVGVAYSNRTATEADIIGFLSSGKTPTFAQPQKFRLIAPSDNCDLVKFDDNPTVYTYKFGTLYPITGDAWKSMGLSINFTPQEGSYDSSARKIPMRILPGWQRGSYWISSEFAPPRTDAVFKGASFPAVYVYRYGQKNLLNANQFGSQDWQEYHWSEIQTMDQNYVDRINPRTYR